MNDCYEINFYFPTGIFISYNEIFTTKSKIAVIYYCFVVVVINFIFTSEVVNIDNNTLDLSAKNGRKRSLGDAAG